MKTWTKLLVTTSIIAMMALPLPAAAAPQQAAQSVKEVSDANKAEAAATRGIISEIVHTKYGVFAMLEGEGVKSGNPDVVKLVLTDDVEVVDQEGNEVNLYEAFEQEWTITATYGTGMTRSIPPQATAVKIVVEVPEQDELSAVKSTGIIAEALEVQVEGDNEEDYYRVEVAGANPVILNVTEDTEIVDEKGNELDMDVLEANLRIEATYGPIMTMSLPPMTNAEKIVVLGDSVKVEGQIASVEEGQVHIDVKSDNQVSNDVILTITKDTDIVDVYGQKVELSELKKGDKVVGYHSHIMTRSLPAQSHADMIVVQTVK